MGYLHVYFSKESETSMFRRVIKTLPCSAFCFWDKIALTEVSYSLFKIVKARGDKQATFSRT